MAETKRRPRMSKAQASRLRGLLPMEYRPTELAREIGCHRSTIYESYVPNGCPHRRDANGHLWIVGTEFAAWAREVAIRSTSVTLKDDEAFCLRCGAAVKIRGPITEKAAKSAIIRHGRCPQCFGDVARFVSPELVDEEGFDEGA